MFINLHNNINMEKEKINLEPNIGKIIEKGNKLQKPLNKKKMLREIELRRMNENKRIGEDPEDFNQNN